MLPVLFLGFNEATRKAALRRSLRKSDPAVLIATLPELYDHCFLVRAFGALKRVLVVLDRLNTRKNHWLAASRTAALANRRIIWNEVTRIWHSGSPLLAPSLPRIDDS
jgi:hypothetical protein